MKSSANLRVDWCSYDAAKFAVKEWHYSKRMPRFKQVYLGVWEAERFIGSVIFGLSVTPYLGDSFGLTNTECAELTRIALRHHNAPVSRIASIAVKKLRSQSPGLKLLVSYADPFKGHNGGIYQAMNWIYVGESSRVRQYFLRGDWRNDTSLMRLFGRNPKLKQSTRSRLLPGKYKYLLPLTEQMRKQILPLSKPYPKRAGSETVDTPANHAGEGGSLPTPALPYLNGE